MLLWGGYPNVITLMLIPLTFYLYLQKDRFSITAFSSFNIYFGRLNIFNTFFKRRHLCRHNSCYSALCASYPLKLLGTTRKTGLYWLLPIVLGAILFSPFLIQAVPAYLTYNSSLAPEPTSSNAINLATLSTRILPLELVLPLFGVTCWIHCFLKKILRTISLSCQRFFCPCGFLCPYY